MYFYAGIPFSITFAIQFLTILILIKKGGGTGPLKPWQPFSFTTDFGAKSFSIISEEISRNHSGNTNNFLLSL